MAEWLSEGIKLENMWNSDTTNESMFRRLKVKKKKKAGNCFFRTFQRKARFILFLWHLLCLRVINYFLLLQRMCASYFKSQHHLPLCHIIVTNYKIMNKKCKSRFVVLNSRLISTKYLIEHDLQYFWTIRTVSLAWTIHPLNRELLSHWTKGKGIKHQV